MKKRLTAEMLKHEFDKIDKNIYLELEGTGNVEHVINFAEAFAAQEVEAEIRKLMPSNEKINAAAKEWAREHSNAPDKDCPEWILQDYEAGACFVRQCFGCLNKEVAAIEMPTREECEKVFEHYHPAIDEDEKRVCMKVIEWFRSRMEDKK
jgi:hypothetical protein